MARTPLMSQVWNVPLYVSATGLTTGLITAYDGGIQVDFALLGDHRVSVVATDGREDGFALEPMTTAELHRRFHEVLDGLGLATETWDMPVEIPDAIPFTQDTIHAAYDAEAVH